MRAAVPVIVGFLVAGKLYAAGGGGDQFLVRTENTVFVVRLFPPDQAEQSMESAKPRAWLAFGKSVEFFLATGDASLIARW